MKYVVRFGSARKDGRYMPDHKPARPFPSEWPHTLRGAARFDTFEEARAAQGIFRNLLYTRVVRLLSREEGKLKFAAQKMYELAALVEERKTMITENDLRDQADTLWELGAIRKSKETT